jgi:hypothetical protein
MARSSDGGGEGPLRGVEDDDDDEEEEEEGLR